MARLRVPPATSQYRDGQLGPTGPKDERENDPMFTKEFKCMVCDKPENQCTCNRYCALCHADYELRLTEDGQYYCRDCREACDFKSQDQA